MSNLGSVRSNLTFLHIPLNAWGLCKVIRFCIVGRNPWNNYLLFFFLIASDWWFLSVGAILKHFERTLEKMCLNLFLLDKTIKNNCIWICCYSHKLAELSKLATFNFLPPDNCWQITMLHVPLITTLHCNWYEHLKYFVFIVVPGRGIVFKEHLSL